MRINNHFVLLATIASLLLLSFPSTAKVSQKEAERLRRELTPIGAVRAGNAEGTIPYWNGGVRFVPPHRGKGDHTYPDPYSSDRPLFQISAFNYSHYADKLSEGSKAMFKAYPNTFKMLIYPTRRDSRQSEWIADRIYENATNAELVNGGNGVKNAYGGIPFPLPNNGTELVWNHNLKERPYYQEAIYRTASVFPGGVVSYGSYEQILAAPYLDKKEADLEPYKGRIAMFVQTTLEPARKKGDIVLLHEYLNQTKQARKAWVYLPGSRRVRRAPTVGYDTPDGLGGLRTTDGADAFNGAVDRYSWTILGKKELYIPYNLYRFDSSDVSYEEMLTEHHINPELMRYELHRVWVLEGELKAGERHVYTKRVMYVDEDSWLTALADYYDRKGRLWRTTTINSINAWDMPGILGRAEIYHDLMAKAYMVDRLVNHEKGIVFNGLKPKTNRFFTSYNLRKMGRR